MPRAGVAAGSPKVLLQQRGSAVRGLPAGAHPIVPSLASREERAANGRPLRVDQSSRQGDTRALLPLKFKQRIFLF